MKEAAIEVFDDMEGVLEGAKSVLGFSLPDGRKAELHIVITTEEDNFLLQ